MKSFKRILSLCLMLVMLAGLLLTGYAVSSSSDEAGILRGDVNGDGRINVGDVSIIYAHAKKTKLITDAHKFACADYNGDGRVNVGDASAVYAVVKGGNKPSVKSVTLSVWTGMNDQWDEGSWLQQMEAAFQKEHPEYKITWENGECHEGDAANMIIADPAAAADVYMFANDQIGTLIEAGAITQLTGKYLEQVQKDNPQTMVGTVTYTDGGIYGFPMSNNTWFMYYNKNIFSEEDVKSLDTMLTKGVVAFPWGVGWYSGTFFLANGGTLFGDQGIDASAGIQFGADNGGYEAALKMVQLAAHPNFKDDVDGLGIAGLKTGDVGAFFSGSWDYYGLYAALGDQLGAVQLPMVEIGGQQKQMKAFAGSKGVAVNPHAQEPELAMEFAAFLATPESQKLRYEDNGTIPAAATLAQDPDIQNDMVALAELNTIANAAVVQPIIPEMNNYWTPIGYFGGMVANGETNESNHRERVDHMMFAFDNWEDPNVEKKFRLEDISYNTGSALTDVTLRIHYNRPDGNYDGWEVCIWEVGKIQLNDFEPSYQFHNENGEMICTVQVSSGTNMVGFVICNNDLEERNAEEEFSIRLTNILCGTVDVYVEADAEWYKYVDIFNTRYGATVVDADYDEYTDRLYVRMSSNFKNDPKITLYTSTGEIELVEIKQVQDKNWYYSDYYEHDDYCYYLTPAQELQAGSYTLDCGEFAIDFEIL